MKLRTKPAMKDADYWCAQAMLWQHEAAIARREAFNEAAIMVARKMAGFNPSTMQDVWFELSKMRDRCFGG